MIENVTALDIAIVVILILVALGGYRQGFVRGVVRMLAILSIGLLSTLLLVSIQPEGTLPNSLMQSGTVAISIALAIAAIAWLVNRLVSYRVHMASWNRALGVIPAVLQAVLIAAVLLGLAYRLAITPEQQAYIAQGVISGPLSRPLNWVERALAGHS